jgi:hypothetical protein
MIRFFILFLLTSALILPAQDLYVWQRNHSTALNKEIKAFYQQSSGKLFFLAGELENQISPDASCCMVAAIEKIPALPGRCTEAARMLGRSLGRFDTQGQLQGIEGVRQFCRRNLDELANGREQRLRNYQTLGLCTGAALVILFI